MASSRDDDVLARLAASPAYLSPHHLAAAETLEQLIRRAQLAPRVTMSYDLARIGATGGNAVETASESAADARLRLSRLASQLPPDCWGVLFDVCGLGKGLQLIETERRWPRRSAKLVLRIGLEQLASQFGLGPHAVGREMGRARGWLPERLPLIAESTS